MMRTNIAILHRRRLGNLTRQIWPLHNSSISYIECVHHRCDCQDKHTYHWLGSMYIRTWWIQLNKSYKYNEKIARKGISTSSSSISRTETARSTTLRPRRNKLLGHAWKVQSKSLLLWIICLARSTGVSVRQQDEQGDDEEGIDISLVPFDD